MGSSVGASSLVLNDSVEGNEDGGGDGDDGSDEGADVDFAPH